MSATYRFPPIRRGDSKSPTVFLRRRGILTLERSTLLSDGDVVEWTLSPSGRQPIVRTGAPGLRVVTETGEVGLPLTPDDTHAMPLGTVPFALRVTNSDGVATTHLTGALSFTD